MSTKIATALMNTATNAMVDACEAGGGAGNLKIYTGPQPASIASAPTGTLLATITLANPAFGASVGGQAALTAASATASGTGTAGWFRISDSAGTAVFDGAVTTTGGGGELELDITAISPGWTVRVTGGFQLTV